MDFKLWLKLALLGIAIFCGVQFSLVYINRTQLKSIMESEALDARRARNPSEESVIRAIRTRAEGSNVYVPDEENIQFTTEGIEDDSPDLVVYADYVHYVNLLVYKYPMKVAITARAEAPK
jgi:hypothetical protein